MLTICNSWCQKNLEVSRFKEDESDCIRGLLSKWQTSFRFFTLYFFLRSQSAISLFQNMLNNSFFLGVNSETLFKSSCFRPQCLALHYGQELWMLMLRSSRPQTFLLAQPKEMEGSLLKCVLDAINGHLQIGIIGFWTRRWSGPATSGDEKLIVGIEKVGSKACSAEC
jgi:hypothetical protein